MGVRQTYSPMMIKRAETLEDENIGVIEGRFITFNSVAPYGNTGYFEMIDSHALDESLKNNRDICCFYNHNTDIVLGRESNGTLSVELKEDGLYATCKINLNDSDCKNAYERIKGGYVSGCSFGAYFEDEELVEMEEKQVFVVKKVNLLEISPCAMPFYDSTMVNARQKIVDDKEALDRRWEAFRNGIKKTQS